MSRPLVISYLRFSRPEQLKGDSIRRQLTLGDEWATKRGLKVSESWRDQGVSAFRGKNAAEGNLARLLALIDAGKIPAGSVLLIEQLDRLSRNALLEALELFLSIIRRGIKIVTLMDGMEYDRESLNRGMQQLMYSLMQMSLAHEESAKKSERLAHAWVGKRMKMAERPLTRQLPAWLKVEGNKIVIDDTKGAIVRRIVRLVLDGHGLTAVTKKVNAEFNGLARVHYFNRSYVTKISRNRALIGEFQPHKITYENGKRVRVPIGEPVKGYYPALLDEQTFYAMQRQLGSRRSTGGRNKMFVNLFLGLLYDAHDGSRMQINDKGYGRRYASSASMLGVRGASEYVGFPAFVLERAVLFHLHDHILPRLRKGEHNDDVERAAALEGQIAEVERKIDKTTEQMLANESMNTPAVVAALAKLDHRKKALADQLDMLRGDMASRAATSLDGARQQVAEVVRYYRTGKLDISHEQRVELRGAIRSVIERIDLRPEATEGRSYVGEVKVTLKDASVISFFVFAERVDRMKRGPKGHPVKSETTGTPPQFKLSLGEPRFFPTTHEDGTFGVLPQRQVTPARLRKVAAAAERTITRAK